MAQDETLTGRNILVRGRGEAFGEKIIVNYL
jgi:hypothetical protein